MFFEYQSGFEVEDILGQIEVEKKVAKGMALNQRLNWLSRFERLICHFFECNTTGKRIVTPSSDTMSTHLVKMKMANEAKRILQTLDKSPAEVTAQESNTSPVDIKEPDPKSGKKVYKYTCHVSEVHK